MYSPSKSPVPVFWCVVSEAGICGQIGAPRSNCSRHKSKGKKDDHKAGSKTFIELAAGSVTVEIGSIKFRKNCAEIYFLLNIETWGIGNWATAMLIPTTNEHHWLSVMCALLIDLYILFPLCLEKIDCRETLSFAKALRRYKYFFVIYK